MSSPVRGDPLKLLALPVKMGVATVEETPTHRYQGRPLPQSRKVKLVGTTEQSAKSKKFHRQCSQTSHSAIQVQVHETEPRNLKGQSSWCWWAEQCGTWKRDDAELVGKPLAVSFEIIPLLSLSENICHFWTKRAFVYEAIAYGTSKADRQFFF